MKLLVDTTCMRPPITGIGRFAMNLLSHLGRQHPEWEWLVLVDGTSRTYANKALPQARMIAPDPPVPVAFPARQQILARMLEELGPDAFLNPASAAPENSPCPSIVTIHDIALIARPGDTGDPSFLHYHFAEVQHACKHAHRILVPSTAVQTDLASCFNVPLDRTVVVPLAADARFGTSVGAAGEAALTSYGLASGYVFAMHLGSPRKNAEGLFAAYARLGADTRRAHPLVVAGDWSTRHVNLWSLAYRHAIQENVRFLGFVPDEHLPALYANAAAFCYVSWLEGFGIPVIEAMASGVPVIAADTAALPETAGGAAELVPPGDPAVIAEAINHVLADDGRARDLVGKGKARAAELSWERTAQRIASTVNELACPPPPTRHGHSPRTEGVYFFCHPQGPPERAAYQHQLICLAEGLRSLGVPVYANTDYWALEDSRGYLLARDPKVRPEDCSAVVMGDVWLRRGRPMPEAIANGGCSGVAAYMEMARAPEFLNRPEFGVFDLRLRCHCTRQLAEAGVLPWPLGLSTRMLRATQDGLPGPDREACLLVNSLESRGMWRQVAEDLLPHLGNLPAITYATNDDIPAEPRARREWERTGKRHRPAFYSRLQSALAICCFGGEINDGQLVGWDSLRFWESLGAGCAVLHVDLQRHGAAMPVLPRAGQHYIGVDLDSLQDSLATLADPVALAAVGARGRQWALGHYSPEAVARRFLRSAGLSSLCGSLAEQPGCNVPMGVERATPDHATRPT